MDRIPEWLGAAGGKRDRDRLVRFGEIVDINPVGGARPLAPRFLQDGFDGLLHPRAARTDHEEVETRLLDPRGEADGVERALLPHQAFDGFDFRRGLE